MLRTEGYPRTNNDLEDRARENKTWAFWKTAYKRVHAKAHVKAQATKGSDKFGKANAAGQVLKTSEVEASNGGDKVGIKDIEVYFDNIGAAPIN